MVALIITGAVVLGSRFIERWRRRVASPAAHDGVALRHLTWAYRSWARHHEWTEEGDGWRGTLRGCPVLVCPNLRDGAEVELTLEIAHELTRQSATLSVRGTPKIAFLTRFFDDEGARLARLEVTTNGITLWFAPLTAPELVIETAEAIVTSLVDARRMSPSPFR